ncbi:MAG: GNAT family N-acetyltransferase [Saprospiraceae bacterium]|nr:GNAT family N-acetyltransferase [Saprospiraceae bacterium]
MELIPIKQTIEENSDLLNNVEIKDNVQQTIDFYKKVGFKHPWIGYCVQKDSVILGMAGFKGQPADGKVEISYGTNEQFRQKGIGTEICKMLGRLSKRTNPTVVITARTLPERSHSTKILENNDFELLGTVFDEEDGEVWEWKYKSAQAHNIG